MIKLNLEDLTPQSSFPNSLGKDDENISLVFYNTLKRDVEKKDIQNFIIELLMSINEQTIQSIGSIFKYEIDSLKDLNTDCSNLIYLSKLNDFFESSSLENITVFSSLHQGPTEIKSNIHFREEILVLSEIIERLINLHIENYKEVNENDDDFDKINSNTYFLQNISNMIKVFATKNLKKIASEINSKMNIEDQVKIISKLIHINSGHQQEEVKQLGYKGSNQAHPDDETVEEAFILDDELENGNIHKSSEDDKAKIKEYMSEAVDELKFFLQDTIKIALSESNRKLNEVQLENKELKDKLKLVVQINENLLYKFNGFLEKQNQIQKVIKDKYKLDL